MNALSTTHPPPFQDTRAPLASRLLPAVVVVALFGQPNGLYIYLPFYPLLVLVILTAFAVLVFRRTAPAGGMTIARISLVPWTALFLFYSLLSLVYAPDSSYGARILFSMLAKFLLFVVIVTICVEVRDIRRLLYIVAMVGGFFSLQAVVYVFCAIFFNIQPLAHIGTVAASGGRDYGINIESYGPLGFAGSANSIGGIRLPRAQAMFTEPGWLSAFLELSLFATLAWLALEGPRARRAAYWLLALQIGALLFTFSTAGWAAVSIGMALFIGLRLFVAAGALSRRRLVRLLTVIACVLGVVALLLLSFPKLTADVYNAVYTVKFVSDAQEATSAGDRLSKIQDALSLFSQRPLFGWGTNQMPIVTEQGNAVSNAFITVAAELGIVGLAIYTAMTVCIAITIVHNLRMAYRSKSVPLIEFTAAISSGMAALFIHALFIDSNWSFFYWIGLALVYVNHRFLLKEKGKQS